MSSLAIVPSATTKNKTNEKTKKDDDDRLARARAIAIQQAMSIEEKKNLQTKVLDMILIAYDLPKSDADPANPSLEDVKLFRQCLAFFRPSDLDELVSERNIDDRCGYALCKNPNVKETPKKVWDSKGRFVEKNMHNQWCSKECKNRNNYIRKQLSEEPVWLRSVQNQHIVLLMDNPQPPPDVPDIKITQENDHELQLADERGGTGGMNNIIVIEKEQTRTPKAPKLAGNDVLEGLPIRSLDAIRKQNKRQVS